MNICGYNCRVTIHLGCGWFGIQTWIGGAAIYNFIAIFLREFRELRRLNNELTIIVAVIKSAPSMGEFQGINVAEFFCFWIFWIANMAIVFFGPGIAEERHLTLQII
jgi:cytosine/uracil/thiamine/allantoin permease